MGWKDVEKTSRLDTRGNRRRYRQSDEVCFALWVGERFKDRELSGGGVLDVFSQVVGLFLCALVLIGVLEGNPACGKGTYQLRGAVVGRRVGAAALFA